MSVEKQYVHLVLSDGDKYTDYIAAEGMLRNFEFIEEDKFRVNGENYYEGIILCRGKSKEQLRRLVKKNRKAIPVYRFRPFPSPKGSNIQFNIPDNVGKQTPRQTLKITQPMETKPNSPTNKYASLTNPEIRLMPEQKMKKTVSDEYSVDEKFAATDIDIKISQKSEKKKLEEDTNKKNAVQATGNSSELRDYPHRKWYKYKQNIANIYRDVGKEVCSRKENTSENTGHNQSEEFLVVSTNEQNERKNSNSEIIVEMPINTNIKENPLLATESTIEQNFNLNEATKFSEQLQAFPHESEQHEYYSTKRFPGKRNSTPTVNRIASSPLLSHLESTFGTRKRFSEKVESSLHMRKYTQLLTKYEKLDKQYEKMRTTNFFLLQFINDVSKDTKKLITRINMFSPPSDYLGESIKSSHRSPFRNIILLSDDESNTDDDIDDL